MNYVEVHPRGEGLQIRFQPPREGDEPFISNADFLGPVLGHLGVRLIGDWEEQTDSDGATYQRAVIA